MNVVSAAFPDHRKNLIFAILAGGAVAGTFDLISAFITFGPGVPRGIASGLLGRQAMSGGMATWILGVFLHYFVAFSAACVFCVAGQKLKFFKDHFVVCGLFFGIAVFLVMTLIVLPLCAFHARGPYQLRSLIQGLLTHMVLIGLPISYSFRKFST